MIIHAKLDTMPAARYRLKDLSKADLSIGDAIYVRPVGYNRRFHNWKGAKVDKVDTVDGRPFYFLFEVVRKGDQP